MHTPARHRLRASLAISTAMAGLLMPGQASAQVVVPGVPGIPAIPDLPPVPTLPISPGRPSLPDRGDAVVRGTSPDLGGLTRPVITSSNRTLDVDLRATSTVIDWQGFNVPEGSTASFNDGRDVFGGTAMAVLNRDISGRPSQLLGTLRSDPNVAIWVLNGNGILVGADARINTGSLVLSTLDMDPADFLSEGSYRLSAPASHSAAIVVEPGARVTVTEGNRGLVLLAPAIRANGAFAAGQRDVAFVTATDVTLTYQAGSPLSVAIDRGTTVGGQSQIVQGTVSGRGALFALATQASVTDALLRVDASVTTAAAGTRGIVLSAGARAAPGVEVRGTASTTGGVAGIAATGPLAANGENVVARATGIVTLTGSLQAARDVVVDAGGLAAVTSGVAAQGAYTVTGTGVTLGGAMAATQHADGTVAITATRGSIAGADGLTLRSNDDAIGADPLVLSAGGAGTGDILFAPGSTLMGGLDRQSDVVVRFGSATSDVALGDVFARGLLGRGLATDGLVVGTPLRVGDVLTRAPLALGGAGVVAGSLRSEAGVSVASAGDVVAETIRAAGAVTLTGSGATIVTGLVDATGSGGTVTIARGGAVRLGPLAAAREITIGSAGAAVASIAVTAGVTGGDISMTSAGAQEFAAGVGATGALLLDAGGALVLRGGAVATNDLTLRGAAVSSPFAQSAAGALAIAAGSGGVGGTGATAPTVAAARDLSITAAGGVAAASATSSAGGVRLVSRAGPVTAGALVASRDVVVEARNAAALTGTVSAGGAFRVTGDSVLLGSTTGAAVSQAAAGEVAVTAGAGGIAGSAGLTLRSNRDGMSAEALTLAIAPDAPGGAIAFAPNSALIGGTARESDIQVRSGADGGAVTLGRVEARGLLGAVGTAAFAPGIGRTGALVLGDVRLTEALLLDGAGIGVGTVVTDGAAGLTAAGSLTATAIFAGSDVTLAGSGDTGIEAGPVRSGGTIRIDRDGAARFGELSATGDLLVGTGVAPSTLDVARATSGGTVSLIAQGALRVAGDITAAGNAAFAGGTVELNGLVTAGGDLSAAASAGRVLLARPARAGGAMGVTASGAAELPADLVAGSLSIRADSVALGAGATQVSAGSIDVAALGGVVGGQGLTLRSTSADAADFVRLQAAGADGIRFAEGSRIIGGTDRSLAVAVRAAGLGAPITLAAVEARSLVGLDVADGVPARDVVTASGPLRFGALSLRETFRATATSGDLSLGSAVVDGAGQSIELRARLGTLSVPAALAADGAVVLDSGADLALGTVVSGTGRVSASSAGTLTATALTGPGGVVARGGSVDLGGVAGGSVDLAATVGDLRLGGATGTAVSILAAGEATVAGAVAATRGYTVTGSRVTLGGQQSAAGGVDIRARAGDVISASGLRLTADSDGAGAEPLRLEAIGGTVSLAADSRLIGGPARGSAVTVLGGPGLVLGAVDARALTVGGSSGDGALVTGDLSLIDDLALAATGGIRTGAVTVDAGGVRLGASGGTVDTRAVNAAGAVRIGAERIAFSEMDADGIELAAGNGGLAGGTIASRGSATLAALDGGVVVDTVRTTDALGIAAADGGIALGSVAVGGTATLATTGAPADIVIARGLTAADTVRLTSTRDIRAPFVTSIAGDLFVTAAGDVTALDPGAPTILTAGPGRSFSLETGGTVRLGAVTGAALSLRAGSIDAVSVDVGVGTIDLSATTGDLRIGGPVRGGTVTLDASGRLVLGNVAASGALLLDGGTGLSFGTTSGAGVVAVSGGAIDGGSVASTNGIALTAADGLSVGAVRTTAGDATLTATDGDAVLGTGIVAGDLVVTSRGSVSLPGEVVAGGRYVVRGASAALGSSGGGQRAGGGIAVTATGGDIVAATGATLASTGGASAAVTLDAAGAIAFGGTAVEAGAGGTAALGLRAGEGRAIALGRVGARSLGDLRADGTVADTLARRGDLAIETATVARLDVTLGAGNLRIGTVSAADAVRLATTVGAIDLGTMTAGGAVGISAGGTVAIDRASARSLTVTTPGDLGGRDGGGAALATTGGDLLVTGGAVRLASADAIGALRVMGATVDASGQLAATRSVAIDARTALNGETVTAGGDLTLASGGTTTLVAGQAGGAALVTSAGALTLGALTAGGAARIEGNGAVAVDRASAATLAITAAGDLGGRADGASALATTGGDLTVTGANGVRLASADSAGALAITGGAVDASGRLAAARSLLVRARDALTAGQAVAGGDLTLVSDGSLGLGGGQAGGTALVDAVGPARLGALSAGPTLTIRAADADITGIQRATSVLVENRAPDTRALRVGDGTGTDGFRLSNAEVGFIEADALALNGGTGAIELGTLAFDADAGRRGLSVLGTGAITVTGAVSGTGRAFRIGGTADSEATGASDLRVAATTAGGGRLLFGGADLELRGDRIAVGLAPGFLDALSGPGAASQATTLVATPNSALYNAGLGGGVFAPGMATTVAARTLTLRYGAFALFQNTGVPGSSTGVVLGDASTMTGGPILRLLPTGPAGTDSFALFGTLNGFGATAASLLGPDVVSLGSANLASTRINGCQVGSGGGCLRTVVIQPTLQVFDRTREDVFGVARDLTVPFDPVIGGGNEELLIGLDALVVDLSPPVVAVGEIKP